MSNEREIEDLATDMLADRDCAQDWMRTPNRYLGGKVPRDIIDTEEGRNLVIESLYAIAYGGVA